MVAIKRLEHFLGHIMGGDEYLDDVGGIRARITELERELADSREEAKKWEKRFEFLANKVLAGIPCQSYPKVCEGCHEKTYEICREYFIAAADREAKP